MAVNLRINKREYEILDKVIMMKDHKKPRTGTTSYSFILFNLSCSFLFFYVKGGSG